MNTIFNEFKRWKNDEEAQKPIKSEAKTEVPKDKKNQNKTEAKPLT